MQIKTLNIRNFKNYYGTSSVDLTLDNSKGNIILIGGKNGYGKTSFCEAIKLCLFGKKLYGKPMSNKDYEDYLIDSFNTKAKKNGENEAFVMIQLSLSESIGSFDINITRSWEVSNGKFVDEKLTILRGEKELEYVPKEYWETYLEKLIPPYLAKLFIFDGERVEDFAESYEFKDEIRNSIKDAVGLKKHEILYSDLSTLQSKIKRANIDENGIRNTISELDDVKSQRKKSLEKTESEIISLNEKIEDLSIQKNELEKEIDRIAGALSKGFGERTQEIRGLQDKRHKIKENVIDITGNFLPFVIPSRLFDSLSVQLDLEHNLKEKISSKRFLERVNGEFSSSLRKRLHESTDIDEKHTALIEKCVKETFDDFLNETEESKIIHDLSKKEINRILFFMKEAKLNVNNGFQEKLEHLRDIDQNISELHNQLNGFDKGIEVRELINQMADYESKNASIKEKIKILMNEEENIENEIVRIEKEIKQLENQIVCAEVDRRKIDLVEQVKKVLEEVETKVIRSKIDKLEAYISEMYHKLANKDDMVAEIKINKDTFNIDLFDSDGNKLNKGQISTGEKEIFALSLLDGLIRISTYDFPVIIDAPLTSLDKEHCENILLEFTPNLGDQVIMFSTDREVDKDYYDLIKDNVNKEYIIEKDGPDKIKGGYFFEQ